MKKTPLLLFLLLLPATALLADEVFLKGAGSISGRIVEQTDTTVMVDIGGGVMGVPMSHVDHIVKARSPLDDYDDRAGRLTAQDVNGWRELARWASSQGLTKQSLQAYEKVLAIAPNDPEAKEALGFVLRADSTRQVRGQAVQIQTTFDDYSKTNGILFPHLVVVQAVGRPQSLRVVVDTIEVNPPLDDKRFEMPPTQP